MGVTLHCTAGPSAGESITIDVELVLGRDQPEPGRLRGDPRLSRRHARVFIDDRRRPTVEDLGSTNGTRLNGERLTEARILKSGDELQLGQTTFAVDVPAQDAETQLDTAGAAVSPAVAEPPPPAPALLVLAGRMQGEEITLGDELLIGRGYGEPGALGGDRRLSRRHARIARGPGGVFFIEDTGSTNGTMLNSVLVRGAHPLKDGDEIELGSSKLQPRRLPGAPLAGELTDEPAATRVSDRKHAAASTFVPQGAAGTRLSSRRVIGVFGTVFASAVTLAVAAVLLGAPLGSRTCPKGFICHKPPTAPPLRALTTFTGSLGWRAEYDAQLATPARADVSGNQLVLRDTPAEDRLLGASPGSNAIGIWLRAYPARQVSAQAALQSMAGTLDSVLVGASAAPSSDQLFGIPVLGFHRAAGEVLEGDARTPQGPGPLVKVAVLAASSGAVTVVAGIFYPVRQGQSQATNPDTPLDTFADQVLETVRFPSDGAT